MKPWITPGIIKSISKRDFYFRKFIKSKHPDMKSGFHENFKLYRNLIVTLCRRSKSNYFTNYFDQYSSNMKKIWSGVRNIISLKSSKSTNPITLNIGNSTSSDPEIVANCFNDFFTSVADNVRSTIPATRQHFDKYLRNQNPNSIFLSPTSPEEISKIISTFSPSKSSGPHSIPVRLLKLLLHDISVPISILINLSLESGIFPTLLKTSKVIPIFKKGSPLDVSNYRPISLLSNIEKIFEKVMYSRLISFLDTYNSIFTRQFGFRKSHSTSHVLINIVERIRSKLDKGEFGCGVFVDLQKAFDTVDHEILLSKLNHYGIRGLANQWFRSYLSERSQFVSIGISKSISKSIRHGVPQGSVLGPLLFLLYINDLHQSIKFSETFHFADDTHLLHFSKSIESLCSNVNRDLRNLTGWLNANKISLNSSKTEFVLFRSKSKTLDFIPSLKLQRKRIYPSPSVKYLGIRIDEHLNWKPQISELANKLQRANGALSKLRHYIPLKSLINIYHAIFASHMRYACQIYGLRDSTITHRILTLQKTALRLLTFSEPQSPSSPLFSNLEILKFFDLVEVLNICFVHQHLNSSLPVDNLESLIFHQINHSYNTRGNTMGLLKIPFAQTSSYGLNSLTRLAIQQWNSLQRSLPALNLANIPFFNLKSITQKHYLNSYID